MPEQTLESIAFPTLDERQVREFERGTGAATQSYRDGQLLISVGDREFKFFIVKSGTVEIVDYSGETPKTVVVHGKGQFTGDISHLTGRSSVIAAVARGECKVVEVSSETLRAALNQCPALSDIVLQAFIARRQLLRESSDFVGLRVIGSRYSVDTFRVRDFLAKNRALFTWLDVETNPDVGRLLQHFGLTEADTPVVALGDLLLLRNPSNTELADAIGIHQPLEHAVHDLVVVGAGPAGLAAAVYGASEGLRTVLLERTAPGGQAGASMRIENYLGFPTGLTGSDLADRAILQANKFGARLSVPSQVIRLGWENAYAVLQLDSGETVTTKCLLIATGADYRRLDVEGCSRFEGKGVYYGATLAEGQMCRGSEVVLVGGGNSAGQAAVFLADHASKVHMLVRGDGLAASMSRYLIDRIAASPGIDLHVNTELTRLDGDANARLGKVSWRNTRTGDEITSPMRNLFLFVGADPETRWLEGSGVALDRQGFVITGRADERDGTARGSLETSVRGIFAVGDVRSGSVKRVGGAIGEGAAAVALIHQHLST